MSIEIERKFLVLNDDWRAEVQGSVIMRHGYLAALGGAASVRVRLEGDQGKLNIKTAKIGMSRAEYEYDIPADQADEMLSTLCGSLIYKTRYFLPMGAHTWEIDVFEGTNAPLIVAEIELNHENDEFIRPHWLAEEVTHDRRYYNHALSVEPYSTWPKTQK